MEGGRHPLTRPREKRRVDRRKVLYVARRHGRAGYYSPDRAGRTTMTFTTSAASAMRVAASHRHACPASAGLLP